MKKQNLLKLALVSLAMFAFTGAWAQIDITVKQADGTAAAAATIHTINSSTGVVSAAIATADGTGVFVGFTPTAGTNYIIRNAGATQRNSYAPPAVPANITINLRTEFAETIQDYVSSNIADKVTHSKTMPYWVYPSPVHNPTWTPPAAAYAAEADIILNLSSTFAWTLNGGAIAGDTDNYVEVAAGGDLTGGVAATVSYVLTATETVDAAYGGCAATEPVRYFYSVINPPIAEITNGDLSSNGAALTIGTADYWEIARGCDGDVALDVDVEVAFPNTEEEFPYFMRLVYNVYNPTFDGTDFTLGAPVAFPIALAPTGTDGATAANQTTNPMEFGQTPSYVYGGAAASVQTFGVINNAITVYEFDLNEWNAKISRKSDYVAFRDGEVAVPGSTDKTDVNDANWDWYSNAAIAGTFDATSTTTYPTVGYIVVFPNPVTGPIYHIPNAWDTF